MSHQTYIAQYRLDGYAPTLKMSVYTPVVCASGSLTATPANPTTALAVSFLTGSASDVQAGFRMAFYTPGGALKGYGRVQYSGVPSSSSIPVRELGQGSVQLASGDLFAVWREVPFDTKLVAADSTFAPDGITFSSEGAEPPPMVCSGGNSVGSVDAGQTYRTHTTDGSHTALVNPDSATPPTHFWVNDSGTAFAPGSLNSDASPVLRINQGSWLVKHVASDPDTTRSATQWTHHVVHDATHPPLDVLLTDYNGDADNGVSWTVEVLNDEVTEADIPELALCFLWVEDTFVHLADSQSEALHRSVVTGRSQIVGIGYARRVTMAGSGDDGIERVTFEIQSPLARLSEIAGYSKVMLESATPDEWSKIKTLSFKRGIQQNWMFYTTGTEAGVDFVVDSSFSDARYPAHFLQRSDPVGQMRELADARQGRIVQRERGARFELQYHPALLPLASRP